MATTITANGINFPDGSASAPSIGGTDTNTGLFTGSDLVGFATGGNERLRITSDGKIGINRTSPARHLHAYAAGAGFVARFEGAFSYSAVEFADNGTTNAPYIGSKNDDFTLSTGGNNQRLRITSAGVLEVYPNSSSAGQINLKRSSTTDQETIFYYGSSYLDIETREATGIRLKTNKSDRFTITSDGKVAIGFNAPAVAGLSIANGSTSLGFEFDTGSGFSGGPTIRGYYRPGSAYKSLGITGSDIKFGINDVEKIRIDVNGYLGLGLNDPHLYYAKELVVKAASEGGITIRNTGANDWNYLMFASGTSGTQRYSGWIAYDHGNNKLKIGVNDDVSGKGFEFLANGNLEIKDGNLVVANGHGIDFSATSHASGMSSELLDSYEEGTWTPNLKSNNSTVSWQSGESRTGVYTKIGRMVYAQFAMHGTLSQAYSSHNQVLSGLPHTSAATNQVGVGLVQDVSGVSYPGGYGDIYGRVNASVTECQLLTKKTDGSTHAGNPNFSSGAFVLRGMVIYNV